MAERDIKGNNLPGKSIAVLPFENLSGDPEQEYFADGMVEDITTALSKVRWFFVIARNSAFAYKGRTVDIKQAGSDLGVRYVLEGGVRKAADRVRITGQLIDALEQRLGLRAFDVELSQCCEITPEEFDRNLAGVLALLVQVDRNATRPAGTPTARPSSPSPSATVLLPPFAPTPKPTTPDTDE